MSNLVTKKILLLFVGFLHLSGSAFGQKNTTTATATTSAPRQTMIEGPASSVLQDRLSAVWHTSKATASTHLHTANCSIHADGFNDTELVIKEVPFPHFVDTADDPTEKEVWDDYDQGRAVVASSAPTCHSCAPHDEIIQANLKSIQQHVLHKLGFNAPPNMTKNQVPHVRRQIVEDFMRQYHIKHANVNAERLGQTFRSSKSGDGDDHDDGGHGGYGDDDDDSISASDYDDMQSDDPHYEQFGYFQKEVYEEEEDDYFPITERVYVFPKSK